MSVATVERDKEITRLRLEIDSINKTVQGLPFGDHRDRVIRQRGELLDRIGVLERLGSDELWERYQPDPEAKAARAARADKLREAASTPAAMEARKQEVIRQVQARSAQERKLAAIEAEVQAARQQAADAAEAAVRAKYPAE